MKTESELNKSPAGENDESEKTECPVFESFFNQPDVQLYALLTEQFYDRKGIVSFDKSQKGNERAGRKGRTVTGFVFLHFFFRRIDKSGFDILALFPELPGIDDVLPDDVGTGSDSGDRAHIDVSHPDGENGVFLSE